MMQDPHSRPRPRLIPRAHADRTRVISVGKRREWLGDSYARLLASSWGRLFTIIAVSYLTLNLFFADLYYIGGGHIENARPGVFMDVFFFSVQTLATIGYGKMSPIGLFANILVTIEAFMGFAFYAMITGLIFSKFSRPTARVLFSNVAVICMHDGYPHLMLRMANERRNRIVDAAVTLTLLRDQVTPEGMQMRRFIDLTAVRGKVPLLQLTWTVMHRIDETSPLYQQTLEALCKNNVEMIVSLTGLDETLSQTIHARYSYVAEEILFERVFEDILHRRDDQKLEVHYTKFHRTRPYTGLVKPNPHEIESVSKRA